MINFRHISTRIMIQRRNWWFLVILLFAFVKSGQKQQQWVKDRKKRMPKRKNKTDSPFGLIRLNTNGIRRVVKPTTNYCIGKWIWITSEVGGLLTFLAHSFPKCAKLWNKSQWIIHILRKWKDMCSKCAVRFFSPFNEVDLN